MAFRGDNSGSRKRKGENPTGYSKRRKTRSTWQPPSEELLPLVQKYLREGDYPSMVSLLCPLTVWSRRYLFQLQDLSLALHEAYTVKCFEMVKYFVELRVVHIDQVNSEGLTVLYRAVWDNNKDLVQFLLQHGAQVAKADESLPERSCALRAILGVALEREDIDIIRMLLTAGATIDCGDINIPFVSQNHFSEITNCMLEHGLTSNKKLCDVFLCRALYLGHSEVINKLWQHRQRNGQAHASYTICLIAAPSIQDEHVEMLAAVSSVRHKINVYEMVGARFILESSLSAGLYWWNKARELYSQQSVGLDMSVLPAGSSEGEDIWELKTLESDLGSLKPKACLVVERLWLKWHVMKGSLSIVADRAEPSTIRRRGTSILYRALELGHDFFRSPSAEAAMVFVLTKSVESATEDEEKAAVVIWALRILRYLIECMKETSQKQKKSDENRHDVIATFSNRLCKLCCKLSDLEDDFLLCVDLILPLVASARPPDKADLDNLVMKFIQEDPCLRGRTRLHKACDKFSSHPALIKLLVVCSAEVSSRLRVGWASHLRPDRDGRIPLHVLAETISQEHLIDENVLRTFVNHGTHLCSEDNVGQSVLDVLTSRNLHANDFVPLPLKCLVAKAVRENVPQDDLQETAYKEILLCH